MIQKNNAVEVKENNTIKGEIGMLEEIKMEVNNYGALVVVDVEGTETFVKIEEVAVTLGGDVVTFNENQPMAVINIDDNGRFTIHGADTKGFRYKDESVEEHNADLPMTKQGEPSQRSVVQVVKIEDLKTEKGEIEMLKEIKKNVQENGKLVVVDVEGIEAEVEVKEVAVTLVGDVVTFDTNSPMAVITKDRDGRLTIHGAYTKGFRYNDESMEEHNTHLPMTKQGTMSERSVVQVIKIDDYLKTKSNKGEVTVLETIQENVKQLGALLVYDKEGDFDFEVTKIGIRIDGAVVMLNEKSLATEIVVDKETGRLCVHGAAGGGLYMGESLHEFNEGLTQFRNKLNGKMLKEIIDVTKINDDLITKNDRSGIQTESDRKVIKEVIEDSENDFEIIDSETNKPLKNFMGVAKTVDGVLVAIALNGTVSPIYINEDTGKMTVNGMYGGPVYTGGSLSQFNETLTQFENHLSRWTLTEIQ